MKTIKFILAVIGFVLLVTSMTFPCNHEERCKTKREHREKIRLKPGNGLQSIQKYNEGINKLL